MTRNADQALAEQFIWHNARLLERQRYAYHFRAGTSADVLEALRAYQNTDGGFGHALEPDIRCPDSQPVPTQHALEILSEVGFDAELGVQICDYLVTITTAEGGVPWLLPSAHRYPRAPWWNTVEEPPASINPTAAIVGLLYKKQVDHPWLERATDYCWAQIAQLEPKDFHAFKVAFTFLEFVPDRAHAERETERLVKVMVAGGLVADSGATGYVRKALDWAPTPDHPLRRYFSEAAIQSDLDALVSAQMADGGWPVPWPTVSPACELEWRGWLTVDTLLTLRANGRLAAAA